jgi:hypothetical protein
MAKKRGPGGHPRAIRATPAAEPPNVGNYQRVHPRKQQGGEGGVAAPALRQQVKRAVVPEKPSRVAVALRGAAAAAAVADDNEEDQAAEMMAASAVASPESLREKRHKMDAARAVGYRESLLTQLNAVVLHWPTNSVLATGGGGGGGQKPQQKQSKRMTEAVRLLANLSKELREAGLLCVEKIVGWVLVVSDASTGPKPFQWNGSDYLLKMFVDLDFVSDMLGGKAWTVGCFAKGNPLLLSEVHVPLSFCLPFIQRWWRCTHILISSLYIFHYFSPVKLLLLLLHHI